MYAGINHNYPISWKALIKNFLKIICLRKRKQPYNSNVQTQLFIPDNFFIEANINFHYSFVYCIQYQYNKHGQICMQDFF